jgi:O-antigen ligase
LASLSKVQQTFGRGRTRQLTPTVALGLVLACTGTCSGYAVLNLVFGLTASTILKYVRFGRGILLLVLVGVVEANIKLGKYPAL